MFRAPSPPSPSKFLANANEPMHEKGHSRHNVLLKLCLYFNIKYQCNNLLVIHDIAYP